MDLVTLIAFVMFIALVAAWVFLPGAAATGIADQDTEVVGIPSAQKA
jgi:hypothetical protein